MRRGVLALEYQVDTSRIRALGERIRLIICHNIVAAHAGDISASHSSGGGLCVRVSLSL